jgi:hypothetical protein
LKRSCSTLSPWEVADESLAVCNSFVILIR